MEYAKVGWKEEELIKETISSLKEVFSFRKKYGWELGEIIILSTSAKPKNGQVAGVLVGALYFPEKFLKKKGYKT